MEKESAKNSQFSVEQIKSVLNSAEAKQLIALMQRDGGQRMQQAAAELKKGNSAAAQELLRPMMETQEADALLKKINQKK